MILSAFFIYRIDCRRLFIHIFIQLYVQCRLRQRNPDLEAEERTECDAHYGCHEVHDIIHVKISIIAKTRGGLYPMQFVAIALFLCFFNIRPVHGKSFTENRMKKLVCHSFTTKRINNEWIEIEARQVIKHWLKAHRMNHNRGIVTEPVVMIDVEDEFQQPLKAGLFFEPTDCQTCMCTITISIL